MNRGILRASDAQFKSVANTDPAATCAREGVTTDGREVWSCRGEPITIPPGGTVTTTFTVQVPPSAAAGTSIPFLTTIRFASESMAFDVAIRIAVAGPDLRPSFALIGGPTAVRGRVLTLEISVDNEGAARTEGEFMITVTRSTGVRFRGSGDSAVRTFKSQVAVAPGDFWPSVLAPVWASIQVPVELLNAGPQSVVITVSGGSDVNSSNNTKSFDFNVLADDPDPLIRVLDEVLPVTSGR